MIQLGLNGSNQCPLHTFRFVAQNAVEQNERVGSSRGWWEVLAPANRVREEEEDEKV